MGTNKKVVSRGSWSNAIGNFTVAEITAASQSCASVMSQGEDAFQACVDRKLAETQAKKDKRKDIWGQLATLGGQFVSGLSAGQGQGGVDPNYNAGANNSGRGSGKAGSIVGWSILAVVVIGGGIAAYQHFSKK